MFDSGNKLSIVVPTLGREEVLCNLLRALELMLSPGVDVVVVDQTPRHDAETVKTLTAAVDAGWLNWIRLQSPSIPRAMNVGLSQSTGQVALFLDDDVEPTPQLLDMHLAAHDEFPQAWAVVGQVLQPGEESHSRGDGRTQEGFLADLDFAFWSSERAWVSNVMAGNLSVKRALAISVGGFDENFLGSAFRFETEFARRLLIAGGRILYEPAASLRHLRAERGGTRSEGDHLASASPRHGMGDYYFALRSGWSAETVRYMLKRPFREVSTRFHLRHPWYIPVKLLGELRAFGAAIRACRRGPRLLDPSQACATLERAGRSA